MLISEWDEESVRNSFVSNEWCSTGWIDFNISGCLCFWLLKETCYNASLGLTLPVTGNILLCLRRNSTLGNTSVWSATIRTLGKSFQHVDLHMGTHSYTMVAWHCTIKPLYRGIAYRAGPTLDDSPGSNFDWYYNKPDQNAHPTYELAYKKIYLYYI